MDRIFQSLSDGLRKGFSYEDEKVNRADLTYQRKHSEGARTMDSTLALHPAAPGLFPGVPNYFFEFLMLPRLINGAAAKSSGQKRLKNVDRTHVVLWLVAS